MNAEVIVSALQNEIKSRLDSGEGMYLDMNPTGESYLSFVLQSIEGLGFKVIPTAPQAIEGGYLIDFGRIVHNWNAEADKISQDSVNPGQVIGALQSEGWIVLPPGS